MSQVTLGRCLLFSHKNVGKVTDAGQQQRFDTAFCQYESCCVRSGVCMYDSKGRKNTAQNQQMMKLKAESLSNLHCTAHH